MQDMDGATPPVLDETVGKKGWRSLSLILKLQLLDSGK